MGGAKGLWVVLCILQARSKAVYILLAWWLFMWIRAVDPLKLGSKSLDLAAQLSEQTEVEQFYLLNFLAPRICWLLKLALEKEKIFS